MDDVDNLSTYSSEEREEKETAPGASSSTSTTDEGIDRSMVIFVPQQQESEMSLLTTDHPAEHQLVTLVPQNFSATVADALPLATSEQPEVLSEEIGGEIVTSFLGPVVSTITSDQTVLPQQQTGAFQTEDGQIIYVTYTVNPTVPTEDAVTSNETTQRMVLHVSEDGSTVMLPAESVEVGGFDLISPNDNGILPQWTVNGVYSLVAEGSLPVEPLTASIVEASDAAKDDKEEESSKQSPFNELNNRRRTEQLIGNDLRIEEKLEVLDAMLTPAPERSRKRRKSESSNEDNEGNYMCDLCDITFPRASQFYGHLHSHSGERKWECTACPEKIIFPSQSQLRRHEKESHLNLRPHVCGICSARFDRVSQLSYHERRIHAGERAHACQICNKAFFKRSDLKTHLNIHLGINKCICETCGKKFNHVSNLIRHTRMHSGIKPYPCNLCGRRFTQLNALNQHKTSHQANKDVQCSICRKMFKSHMVMRKHVRQLHRDKLAASGKDISTVLKMKEGVQTRRYYCKVCGENFEFSALLKQHERQHEKENNFHCNCCGQDYESVELLKSHSCQTPEERLQKEAEDEAEAERVALNSQLESFLQEHSDIVGGTEERSNANGSDGLMGEIIIYFTQEGQDEPTQVHIKPMTDSLLGPTESQKSTPVVPESNKKATDDQQGLENSESCRLDDYDENLPDPLQLQFGVSVERNKVGNHAEGRRNSNSTSPLYSLQIGSDNSNGGEILGDPSHDSDCDNGITRRSTSRTNAAAVKIEPAPAVVSDANRDPLATSNAETTVSPHVKKQVRIYQCPECPKTFVKNSNFKQHLGIHFIEQQRYHCANCGQTFAWKSTLNKHMMNHSTAPLPRYRCDLCSKEYSSGTQVQEHIKRDHYKQRPHGCVVCGKTFYKKYDLKIHLRTHTKERPYICGTCGKSFYHLSHIIRHERIHSGHRPYRCSDCGRQFNQSSSLKSHRQRHNQCSKKPNMTELELPPHELVIQSEFTDMGPDAVLLYTGADL